LAQWGGPGTADLNGDGIVSTADLSILIDAFNSNRAARGRSKGPGKGRIARVR